MSCSIERRDKLETRKRLWCLMFDVMDGQAEVHTLVVALVKAPSDLFVEVGLFWTNQYSYQLKEFLAAGEHPLLAAQIYYRVNSEHKGKIK